jgi:hypothetical protein
MTRDLKNRVPAFREKKPQGTPGWLVAVFVVAAITAVLVTGLRRFGHLDMPAKIAAWTDPVVPIEPQFGFYKTLPDSERVVPESDINTEKRETRLGKQPTTGLFFLQAGAFTRQEDAETLRDRLESIVNIKPRLELIRMEYADWYRVKLGPYQTMTDADKVRQFLRQHQIDSIMQTPLP